VDVRGCVCVRVCQYMLTIRLTVQLSPPVCLQVLVDISWAFSKEHVAHLLHKLQRMPPCDFTLDTIELTKKLASTSHHGPAIGRSGMVRVCPLSVFTAAAVLPQGLRACSMLCTACAVCLMTCTLAVRNESRLTCLESMLS